MKKQTCPSPEALQQFLDNRPPSPSPESLQAHLDSCTQCQTVLEALTTADWIPPASSSKKLASDPELKRLREHLLCSSATAGRDRSVESTLPFAGVASPEAPLGRLCEFRVQRQLASGAQGTMYLALDEKLQRQVAIKVLHPGLLTEENNRKRFEREARLAAALNDERIVRVFQVSQEPVFPPFIVMEYVGGGSLKQRLDEERPTLQEAVRWVRDAALGLSVAHQAGLIHRDIKPSNLMLDDKSGLTRLTDFGLALEQADANRMTQSGVLAGTPAYMSPEQLSRPESVDWRTDIYSLGVVLYELLTGEVPFRGTLRMTLLQVAHDEPRSPRQFNDQIPVDLETIVLKAMARDPNLRFSTAREFAAELERWQQGLPILSRPTSRIEKAWRWCRRRPAIAGLSASTLGLLLTLAVVMSLSYFRLQQLARQRQHDADIAAQQRDTALEVLSQLVFQLQTQFEQDIVDVDDVQKSSLQIAIDGLSRLKRLTDQEPLPEALTAEAFRKMGDILTRLDQTEEARDCLVRAERGFRQLQLRPETRPRALEGIVETLWSRHDLELDAGNEDETLIEWLRPATEAARELHALAPSEKTRLMLAQARMHEVQSEFDNTEFGQVVAGLDAKLAQIHELLDLPTEDLRSTRHQEAVRLWIQSVVLEARYRVELSDYEAAIKLLNTALERLRAHGGPLDLLSPMFRHELILEYLLHAAYLDNHSSDQALNRLGHIEQELERMKQEVSKDASLFMAGLEFLQELADKFEEDNDEEGRLFFLEHVRGLLDTRLAQVPDDEFARLSRASCKSEIAQANRLLDQPERIIRDAFQDAIADYRDLSSRASFEEEHWYEFGHLVLEAAEFEQAIGGSEREELILEARRIRNKLAKEFGLSSGLLQGMDERLHDLKHEK